jgi:hypothetical protein
LCSCCLLLVSVALERRRKNYVFKKTDVFLVLKIWQDLAWICFLEGGRGSGKCDSAGVEIIFGRKFWKP